MKIGKVIDVVEQFSKNLQKEYWIKKLANEEVELVHLQVLYYDSKDILYSLDDMDWEKEVSGKELIDLLLPRLRDTMKLILQETKGIKREEK
jgi:hypothetical protein